MVANTSAGTRVDPQIDLAMSWVSTAEQRAVTDAMRDEATKCDDPSVSVPEDQKKKPLPGKGLCEPVQLGAPVDRSSGAGIRTPDTRIMIPLL